MELSPGTILLGKYRIDELIGSGGMGNVVRASHLYLHQSFAIKILLPQMVESDSTVARFLREAQATVRLRSEHIARVQDVGTFEDGTPVPDIEGEIIKAMAAHNLDDMFLGRPVIRVRKEAKAKSTGKDRKPYLIPEVQKIHIYRVSA